MVGQCASDCNRCPWSLSTSKATARASAQSRCTIPVPKRLRKHGSIRSSSTSSGPYWHLPPSWSGTRITVPTPIPRSAKRQNQHLHKTTLEQPKRRLALAESAWPCDRDRGALPAQIAQSHIAIGTLSICGSSKKSSGITIVPKRGHQSGGRMALLAVSLTTSIDLSTYGQGPSARRRDDHAPYRPITEQIGAFRWQQHGRSFEEHLHNRVAMTRGYRFQTPIWLTFANFHSSRLRTKSDRLLAKPLLGELHSPVVWNLAMARSSQARGPDSAIGHKRSLRLNLIIPCSLLQGSKKTPSRTTPCPEG